MGCVCCSLGSFVSILLDALERISLCTVCAMLTCCLLCTIIMVMIIGIGIGFHYCFVQNSVDAMAKAAKAAGALRAGHGSPGNRNLLRSVDKGFAKGFAHRLGRRDADSPPLTNNNNDTIPQNFSLNNNTSFNATMDQITNNTLFMMIMDQYATNTTNFTSY